MRRLIAFIVLAISMLGIVLFNVQASVEGLNWSQEFDNGTEVVYKISVPNDPAARIDMDYVVTTMGNRLEDAGATNYSIESLVDSNSNEYEVRIILGSRHHSNVSNILRSTISAGEFSLYDTETIYGFSGEDSIIRNTAEVWYDQGQPVVKVEITEKAYGLYDHVTSDEGDNLIVLWQGKPDGLTFEDLALDEIDAFEDKTVEELREKVLAVISMAQNTTENEDGTTTETTDHSRMYYDEEEEKYYLEFDAIGYNVGNGASESSAKLNKYSARSFERMMNYDLFDYEITKVYEGRVQASYGDNAELMMIGSAAVAVVAVCIYLILSYGLLAVGGCLGIGITTLLEIFFINFFNIQVGPTLILALIGTLAVAVNMLCVYYRRTRDEFYRGRTIAKAQNEGFRKAISTAIDTTVILAIGTIILSLLARESVKSFSLFLLIATPLNILFVFLLSKIMNGFVCNSSISSNIKLFGYKKEYVADFEGNSEKEMPASLGEKIDVKKGGKKTFIATLIGLIVAVGSVAGFAIAGDAFNYSSINEYGRIEIRCGESSLFETLPDGVEGNSSVLAVDNFVTYIESLDGNIKVTNAWAVTDQVNPYVEDKNFVYFYADLETPILSTSDAYLALEEYIHSVEDESWTWVNTYSVNPGVVTSDFTNTFLLTGVTLALALVYYLIRYRYSLALAATATLVSGSAISVGLLSLSRIPVSSYVGVGLLSGVIITMLLLIPMLNRVNQLKNESKVKVTVYEQREEIALQAHKDSASQFFVTFVGLAVIMFAILPLSPLNMIWIYASAIASLLICGLIAFFGIIPLHLWFEKNLKFTRFKSKRAEARKAKREKLAKANRNRGAEPEEITIIGIND